MTDPRYEAPLRGLTIEEMPKRMQNALRGARQQLPEGTGLILFAFDFYGGTMSYISNANRDDAIAALEEWIRKQRTEQN